ncbi:MAG: DUF2304 domain-containing protein [Clostridia bacterium]|nr:DUF2304 domain-containing protein [Clostridia bacterium]
MNQGLLIALIIGCILTIVFVLVKIKNSQFKIGDTLYWLFFCLFLLAMAIFHKPFFLVSKFFGFESPSNFVFVIIIFLLLIKIFLLDVRIAKAEEKMTRLAQKYAIDNETKEINE